MKLKNAMLAMAVAAVALVATSASALEYAGYFREGPAFNAKGGNQACFSVGGLYKARLGNECDHYLEVAFTQTIYKDDNGVEAKYVFMPAYGIGDTAATDTTNSYGGGTRVFIQQNWAGIKLPQLGGATIWAGNRFYRRQDVHSYDFFFYNPQQGNTTAGIEDVSLGFAKMAFSITRLNGQSAGSVQGVWMLPSLHIYDIPIIENGKVQFNVDLGIPFAQDGGPGDGADISPWFTADWIQDKLFGGSNKLSFQFATGAMSGMGGSADNAATSDNNRFRVVEQFYFAPIPEVSGAAVFILEKVSAPNDGGQMNLSFELRPAYHFSDYFKLALDASYQNISFDADGVDSQNLLKITVAPTLVTGRGFWARPEFRLFATYGKWDSVASQQASTGSAFQDEDNGFVFGAQVEAWF